MSFCGQCGQSLEAGARFCGSCGATVEPDTATPAARATETATATDTAFQAVFEPIRSDTVTRDEEWVRPARRSVSPAAIVGFLALMLVAAGGTVLLLQDDDPASSPTVTTVATTIVTTTAGGPTTTATPTSAVATTTTTPLPPDQQLAATRDADRDAVEAMVGRWVPQLSAKKAGTVDDGITYDLAAIVAFHQQLHTEYGALLLFSGDYVYQTTDLWVSVAPESFATAQGALDWCVSENIGRDDCFAKLITHDETITDSVQMQP